MKSRAQQIRTHRARLTVLLTHEQFADGHMSADGLAIIRKMILDECFQSIQTLQRPRKANAELEPLAEEMELLWLLKLMRDEGRLVVPPEVFTILPTVMAETQFKIFCIP